MLNLLPAFTPEQLRHVQVASDGGLGAVSPRKAPIVSPMTMQHERAAFAVRWSGRGRGGIVWCTHRGSAEATPQHFIESHWAGVGSTVAIYCRCCCDGIALRHCTLRVQCHAHRKAFHAEVRPREVLRRCWCAQGTGRAEPLGAALRRGRREGGGGAAVECQWLVPSGK